MQGITQSITIDYNRCAVILPQFISCEVHFQDCLVNVMSKIVSVLHQLYLHLLCPLYRFIERKSIGDRSFT